MPLSFSNNKAAVAAPATPKQYKPFKQLFCDQKQLLRIPAAALKVWLAHFLREGQENVSWPSIATIMDETGMGESLVYRGRKWLLENGWMMKVGEIPASHGGNPVPKMRCLIGHFPERVPKDRLPQAVSSEALTSDLAQDCSDLSQNGFDLSRENACDLSNQGYEVDTVKVDKEVNTKEVYESSKSDSCFSENDQSGSVLLRQNKTSEGEFKRSAPDRVQNTQTERRTEVASAKAATTGAKSSAPAGVYNTQTAQALAVTVIASENVDNTSEWSAPSAEVITYPEACKRLRPEQHKVLDCDTYRFPSGQMVKASMEWISQHAPEVLAKGGVKLSACLPETAPDPYRNLTPPQILEIKAMEAANVPKKDIVWQTVCFRMLNGGKQPPISYISAESQAPLKPPVQTVPKSRFDKMKDYELSDLLEEEYMFDLNHKYPFTSQKSKRREAMIAELERRETGPSLEAEYLALHRGRPAAAFPRDRV